MMTWNEAETLAAAEKASRLSELLEQDGFFEQRALRWLLRTHVNKFLSAIDAEESTRLHVLAAARYPAVGDSRGFPLLDWLWVVGQAYDAGRTYLETTDQSGAGRALVARLAELNPDWVGRWLQWRCAGGRDDLRRLSPAESAVISALTKSDLESRQRALDDDIIAAVIARKPELIYALPQERYGLMLRSALEGSPYTYDFVGVLSAHGVPSDALAVIDGVLGSGSEQDALNGLDEIIKKWQGPPGSDPVAAAMGRGHERLEELIRSPWRALKRSSTGRGGATLWDVPWEYTGRLFASAARVAPERFRLELGYSIGLRVAEEEAEPSPEKVNEHLRDIGIGLPAGVDEILLPMVELWASLRTLAKYQADHWQRETELVGLRTKVVSLAAAAPGLWAESLSWILARASTLGSIAQAVTLELASSAPEVRAALDAACNDEVEEIRLKASGLRTLLLGLEDDESGLARTLADAAARYMDGSPIFPHPLEPVSLTWLGSTGVERVMADGVRRAAGRFADEVRAQGADIEEALTKALVKEIEVEFREARPRLRLLGSAGSRSQAPVLSVSQRPSSKQSEEPVYGCDLAWLLNAAVRDRYALTWADLVQVKKSSALQGSVRAKSRTDSWKIGCKQLDDILRWSATSAYWLIASGGEVLVIPAKHLLAMRRGSKRGALAKTFTVGYNEARSAAIPLEQYLVDLLVGQWVGSCSEDVIRFARGENSNIRPRIVVEVTITVGSDNQ